MKQKGGMQFEVPKQGVLIDAEHSRTSVRGRGEEKTGRRTVCFVHSRWEGDNYL